MRLSELPTGSVGVIIKILGHGAFRKRMIEMGFIKGREIKVLMAAPLRDPIKYEIMDYEVSLRRVEADLVEVEPIETGSAVTPVHTNVVDDSDPAASAIHRLDRRKVINVALIGNPNCGKTSLFKIGRASCRERV